MQLLTLRLQNFRNHIDSFFEFGGGTNTLLGDNGQGKTNVIEAISYLCLTKSFYAGSDALALNFTGDLFELDARLLSDHQTEYSIRVAYERVMGEKLYSINRLKIEPLSSVIGRFPVVICSPEHAPITNGGPAERRRFVDLVISQSSSLYFSHLLDYRKILRQRNKILSEGRARQENVSALLEPWNEQFIQHGAALLFRRKQFIAEFLEYVVSAYQRLAGSGEIPAIDYVPSIEPEENETEDDIRKKISGELDERRVDEFRLGVSLVGPHRDELLFKINGVDLRKFASQGQHKTFLIALKIAEFYFLRDRCRETPVMLLDDVFSELDERRASQMLTFVETLSQVFITSTNPHLFEENPFLSGGGNKVFHIRLGEIVDHRPQLA